MVRTTRRIVKYTHYFFSSNTTQISDRKERKWIEHLPQAIAAAGGYEGVMRDRVGAVKKLCHECDVTTKTFYRHGYRSVQEFVLVQQYRFAEGVVKKSITPRLYEKSLDDALDQIIDTIAKNQNEITALTSIHEHEFWAALCKVLEPRLAREFPLYMTRTNERIYQRFSAMFCETMEAWRHTRFGPLYVERVKRELKYAFATAQKGIWFVL